MRRAGPSASTDFSRSASVGQACTQAPQDTHSESMKFSRHAGRDAATRSRGPSMVSAKVPCTSSQARTQREQTMHCEAS